MILVPFQLFVGNAIDFIGFDRRWRVSRPKLQKQVGTALAESHPPSMAHRIMRTAMFEPIHGSAFDIAGKGVANPIATFWTASMMLEHLGEKDAAQRLMRAIETVTAKRIHTPDLGGEATTGIVTAAVCDSL